MRKRSAKSGLTAAALALGLAAACSSASDPAARPPGTGGVAGAPASKGSGRRDVERSPKIKRSRETAPAETDPAAPAAMVGPAPGSVGSSSPGAGVAPGSPLATASASIVDPRDDAFASGASPPYTDLLEAALRGRGRSLQMTMSFAARLPERTRDEDEHFIAAIGIRDEHGETRWTFGARCSERGWKPFARSRAAARRFPGRLSVDRTTVRLTIPWSAVNGPHRFEWVASGSWVRTVAGIPSYSIDSAPNGDSARFPS